jgi:hypothetical protein
LIHLKSVSVTIDVPDVEDIIINKNIPAVKTHINFNRVFLTPPSVALFVSDNSGKTAIYKKTNITNTGFDLELLDTNDNLIAGVLDRAIIRGY